MYTVLWMLIGSAVTGVVFLVMYFPVLILLGAVGTEGDLFYPPSVRTLLGLFTIPVSVGGTVFVIGLAMSLIYRKP